MASRTKQLGDPPLEMDAELDDQVLVWACGDLSPSDAHECEMTLGTQPFEAAEAFRLKCAVGVVRSGGRQASNDFNTRLRRRVLGQQGGETAYLAGSLRLRLIWPA